MCPGFYVWKTQPSHFLSPHWKQTRQKERVTAQTRTAAPRGTASSGFKTQLWAVTGFNTLMEKSPAHQLDSLMLASQGRLAAIETTLQAIISTVPSTDRSITMLVHYNSPITVRFPFYKQRTQILEYRLTSKQGVSLQLVKWTRPVCLSLISAAGMYKCVSTAT